MAAALPEPHHTEPVLSANSWRRRLALWLGAIAVALAAIGFTRASDVAFSAFRALQAWSPWIPLALTPAVFALLALLTSGVLRATRGSGIPQVIAALEDESPTLRDEPLSPRVALGKIVLTVTALFGGASVGREGPTVHVGAALMLAVGRRCGFSEPAQLSRFVLAGGAAGIAAAFNTPLAGIVFAIEELSGTFEHRFSGALLAAVIVAGIVSLGLLGDYAYFGRVATHLAWGESWLAVLLCGALGGLTGGLFSRAVVSLSHGSGAIRRWRFRQPVLFAASCGLALAVIGIYGGDGAFGTGYTQARSLLQGQPIVGAEFAPIKFAANLISYAAGIPGGLFSPALATGAGIGHDIGMLMPSVDPRATVLLGMAGYLAGVTQAPLTSAIILMELTDNQDMTLPILATVLLARGASAVVCRVPVYRALALSLLPTVAMPARTDIPNQEPT
jgi:H+/Cl- antiporter ClcA